MLNLVVRKETARLWKVKRIPCCSSEGTHKDKQFSETYRTLTFLTLFIKAHIKRITQSMPKLPFTCANQLFVHLSTHATCRAHFILLDVHHRNNICRRVQVMKLLIIFLPFSCCSLPRRPTYSPQNIPCSFILRLCHSLFGHCTRCRNRFQRN
jgi:hypothetical protein